MVRGSASESHALVLIDRLIDWPCNACDSSSWRRDRRASPTYDAFPSMEQGRHRTPSPHTDAEAVDITEMIISNTSTATDDTASYHAPNTPPRSSIGDRGSRYARQAEVQRGNNDGTDCCWIAVAIPRLDDATRIKSSPESVWCKHAE
jgi:hypothetical protein